MLVLGAACPTSAFADSTVTPPPGWTGTYKIVSPDGRFVLVMLNGVYEEPGNNVSPSIAEANKLLLKYTASGLYKNDGSNSPLWVMPYISWRAKLELLSDGHHMVVWGEWSSDTRTYNDTALTFYEDGRRLTGYAVRNLVMDPEELPHSVSHYQWVLDSALDDVQGMLTVETYNNEKYVFDVSTGKIVSAIIPTVTVKNRVNGKRSATASAMFTSVPEKSVPVTHYQDNLMGGSFLISVSSLAVLFTGVSIQSAKAQRKRLSKHC